MLILLIYYQNKVNKTNTIDKIRINAWYINISYASNYCPFSIFNPFLLPLVINIVNSEELCHFMVIIRFHKLFRNRVTFPLNVQETSSLISVSNTDEMKC